MIYVSGFEPHVLEIRYCTGSGKGKIKIIVQTFMDKQTVTKIKKLLNIIRTSHTPEAELVIADYCRQWLSEYEAGQKALANKHVDSKEKAREIENDIMDIRRARGRAGKNTEVYKKCTDLLKIKNTELISANASVRSSLSDFNRNQKMKPKIKKILEFISQG